MSIELILKSIDDEIERLKSARNLLSSAPAPTAAVKPPKNKRKISAMGRKRIAEAQKKRWAELKKAEK
jgi:hypothetical protein